MFFIFCSIYPPPLWEGKGMCQDGSKIYFIFSFLFFYRIKRKSSAASRALDGHPRWSLVVCRLFILHSSRHFILGYLRCRARGQPQECGDGVANQASAGNNFDQAWKRPCQTRPGLCMKSLAIDELHLRPSRAHRMSCHCSDVASFIFVFH